MGQNVLNSSNDFICKVDYNFLLDPFNLFDIERHIEHYDPALKVLLGSEGLQEGALKAKISEESLNDSLQCLFGMAHARYIMTPDGMSKMLTKYLKGEFGSCPRTFCEEQLVLPVGLSDLPAVSMVKTFCPRCRDVYNPRIRDTLDGAYFGQSFPHMFFMNYPHLRPQTASKSYTPTLYGFKLHPSAYTIRKKRTASTDETTQEDLVTYGFSRSDEHLD